jgi:hypothetical protein
MNTYSCIFDQLLCQSDSEHIEMGIQEKLMIGILTYHGLMVTIYGLKMTGIVLHVMSKHGLFVNKKFPFLGKFFIIFERVD